MKKRLSSNDIIPLLHGTPFNSDEPKCILYNNVATSSLQFISSTPLSLCKLSLCTTSNVTTIQKHVKRSVSFCASHRWLMSYNSFQGINAKNTRQIVTKSDDDCDYLFHDQMDPIIPLFQCDADAEEIYLKDKGVTSYLSEKPVPIHNTMKPSLLQSSHVKKGEYRRPTADLYNRNKKHFIHRCPTQEASNEVTFSDEWVCILCKQVNFRNRTLCRRCGTMNTSKNSGPRFNKDWTCEGCQGLNFSRRVTCYSCSRPKPSTLSKPFHHGQESSVLQSLDCESSDNMNNSCYISSSQNMRATLEELLEEEEARNDGGSDKCTDIRESGCGAEVYKAFTTPSSPQTQNVSDISTSRSNTNTNTHQILLSQLSHHTSFTQGNLDDWICIDCNYINFRKRDTCRQCSSKRSREASSISQSHCHSKDPSQHDLGDHPSLIKTSPPVRFCDRFTFEEKSELYRQRYLNNKSNEIIDKYKDVHTYITIPLHPKYGYIKGNVRDIILDSTSHFSEYPKLMASDWGCKCGAINKSKHKTCLMCMSSISLPIPASNAAEANNGAYEHTHGKEAEDEGTGKETTIELLGQQKTINGSEMIGDRYPVPTMACVCVVGFSIYAILDRIQRTYISVLRNPGGILPPSIQKDIPFNNEQIRCLHPIWFCQNPKCGMMNSAQDRREMLRRNGSHTSPILKHKEKYTAKQHISIFDCKVLCKFCREVKPPLVPLEPTTELGKALLKEAILFNTTKGRCNTVENMEKLSPHERMKAMTKTKHHRPGDWLCQCNFLNMRRSLYCTECFSGRAKSHTIFRMDGIMSGDWICSNCYHFNYRSDLRCRGCTGVTSPFKSVHNASDKLRRVANAEDVAKGAVLYDQTVLFGPDGMGIRKEEKKGECEDNNETREISSLVENVNDESMGVEAVKPITCDPYQQQLIEDIKGLESLSRELLQMNDSLRNAAEEGKANVGLQDTDASSEAKIYKRDIPRFGLRSQALVIIGEDPDIIDPQKRKRWKEQKESNPMLTDSPSVDETTTVISPGVTLKILRQNSAPGRSVEGIIKPITTDNYIFHYLNLGVCSNEKCGYSNPLREISPGSKCAKCNTKIYPAIYNNYQSVSDALADNIVFEEQHRTDMLDLVTRSSATTEAWEEDGLSGKFSDNFTKFVETDEDNVNESSSNIPLTCNTDSTSNTNEHNENDIYSEKGSLFLAFMNKISNIRMGSLQVCPRCNTLNDSSRMLCRNCGEDYTIWTCVAEVADVDSSVDNIDRDNVVTTKRGNGGKGKKISKSVAMKLRKCNSVNSSMLSYCKECGTSRPGGINKRDLIPTPESLCDKGRTFGSLKFNGMSDL